MKSKFGTALALTAVLLTGIAAAAINTQALISPTESTLGTAATTLLPAEQVVSVAPETIPVASGVPTQISASGQTGTNPSTSGQGKNKSNSVTSNSISAASSPIPAGSIASESIAGNAPVVDPTPANPPAATAPSPTPPSIVYGNPNPSNGNDDDDDDDDEDDDEDEDEDDD